MPRPALAPLIRTYGLFELARIAAARGLDRLTGGAVSAFFFQRAMHAGRVYFGEHLGARQGVVRRHRFMDQLGRQEASRLEPHPFAVLEVGSYAGASAITWAGAVRSGPDRVVSVTCIDPWCNYLGEDEIRASAAPQVLRAMARALDDDKVRRLFEHNVRAAGVADIVRARRGRFDEIAPSLAPGSFDIVYIDASHLYPDVLADLQRSAGLVRPGGIVCGDDLERQWPELDPQFCGAQLQTDFVVDPRTRSFVHPGVSRAVWDFFGREVSAWNGFWAMRKATQDAWEPVTLGPAKRA